MEQTKYIWGRGLAFKEQQDMDRLSEYVKEGWLLEKLGIFRYELKKGEPQNIEYSVDYQKDVDDDYFAYFKAGGWSHVCSAANEIHVFHVPEETTPIYTDKKSLIENYAGEKKKAGKIALPVLMVILLLILLAVLGNIGWVPAIASNISLILGYIVLLPLIFTGIPYIGYSIKLRQLRK